MSLDPLILSRLQFVWVVAWHILLPAFTLGLASYIAVLEGLHLATGREIYFRISAFWIRIFAVRELSSKIFSRSDGRSPPPRSTPSNRCAYSPGKS